MSASEKARKQDGVVISESKWEVPKVDSHEDSDFEGCSKSNRKPFHLDVDVYREIIGNYRKSHFSTATEHIGIRGNQQLYWE